jgi:hypothetical protein
MITKEAFRHINLLQAPLLIVGHRWIGAAALFGTLWVFFHLATVVITILSDGTHWGVNAWMLDIMGFLAGFFFTIQCWKSSNRKIDDFRYLNYWISIWAVMTIFSRIFDSLMLFGLLKWDEVYVMPVGVTFWSNVVSEVFLGMAFAVTALIGALILLKRSKN